MSHKKTTHGMSNHRIYRIWSGMKARCNNKNNSSYKNYGGRGIRYDKKRNKFENFIKDMGDKYFEGGTLDRIDNNGYYCKENCKRSTRSQQARNTRVSRNITIDGITKNISYWAEDYGITTELYYMRKKSGMSDIDSLTKPVYKGKYISHNGEKLTMSQWAEKLGVNVSTIHYRIFKKNMSIEKALTKKKYKR